ncbi:hypothetical protein FACS1894139_17640 [Planctomycetales bacterium]|nr:hypothetical protein FACS1894139_17640 [Planctomycetales bacterium]
MNDTNFKNALLALGFAADASGTVLSKRFSDAAGDGARAVRPLTASPREVALPQDAKRGNANNPRLAKVAGASCSRRPETGTEVIPDYRLVSFRDNAEFLKILPKDAPSFTKAATVKDRFRAWKETDQQDFTTRGLFESDITAYTISKIPSPSTQIFPLKQILPSLPIYSRLVVKSICFNHTSHYRKV